MTAHARRARAIAASLLFVVVLTTAGATSRAAAATLTALHVDGARLVDASGHTVMLHGVNRVGSEYMCAQDRGIFDGPMDDAAIAAIRTWGMNAVRIPLNEHCWLGIDDGAITPGYIGEPYRQAIQDVVTRVVAGGLYPILDLHWSAPEGSSAAQQLPMPNTSYSAAFWTSVATRFGGDTRVIFDLYNEPVPNNNVSDDTDDAARRSWECWRDGGETSCDATLELGTETTRMTAAQAVGMRALVDAVRATGATNLILLGGIQWSNTLWSDALHNWLAYRPADPIGNIAAAVHLYPNAWCTDQSCFDREIAPIAAAVPVAAVEFGYPGCDQAAATWLETLMSWLDGRAIGYLAWAWFPPSSEPDACNGRHLITDFAGTPTAYGQIVQAHVAGLPVQTTVTVASNEPRAFEGDSVTFTAQVAAVEPARIPTGNVVFMLDGADQATVALDETGRASVTIAFAENGDHQIAARYPGAAGFGPSRSADLAQPVDNVAPRVDAISGASDPVVAGTPWTVSASFADPGVADTHVSTLDWGDGTASDAAIAEASGDGTLSASHTYSVAGSYRLVATVTDDDGGAGTSALDSLIVVDPSASAAGNGWIDSPAGAYAASRTWTGRASFAFDAMYGSAGSRPTGSTAFSLRGAAFSFQSTTYDWLIVVGTRAELRGAGSLGGVPGYAFVLSVSDGAVDRIRIKIWNSTTHEIAYDSQPGSPDHADPTTALGGGSIAMRARSRG